MNKKFSILVIAAFVFMFSATANAEIFFAYLEGRQEVPPSGSAAKGYARIFVDETTMQISYTVVFNNLQGTQNGAHIHAPAAIGANAGVAIGFPNIGGNSGTITGTAAITATQLAQLRAHQGYVNVHSTAFPGGEIRGQLGGKRPVDFDGDGRQDLSVLKWTGAGVLPMNFWNRNSTSGDVISPVWGDAARDFPAPGDYDGDGMDDYALFRGGSAGSPQSEFWVLTSGTNTVLYYAWGLFGDQAVARDYDGDGKTDVATFRDGATAAASTTWYIRRSSTNTAQVVSFGLTGDGTNQYDSPIPGDYDGDGKFDIAVYRFALFPQNNYIVLQSSNGAITYTQWGNFTTDYILPGDYDGDGKWEIAAGRTGATATSPMVWWIRNSSNGAMSTRTFGNSADFPVQGDYDGDARTDIAIYRQGATTGAPGSFWIFNSFDNTTRIAQWGVNPDFAIARFDSR